MTIRYLNGETIEAVLLAQTGNTLRAAARGSEDLLELTQVNGNWITDDCEPVQVTFEWQRQQKTEEVTLDECLCSPDLAALLINLLHTSSEDDAPEAAPVNEMMLSACAHPLI